MKRAPEPSDVHWENLELRQRDRFGRIIITWVATLVILGLGLSINLSLQSARDRLERDPNKSKAMLSFERSLTFLIAFVVFIINFALSNAIYYFTRFERHQTKTDYYLSVAFKQTIAMFINSVVIPLLVNFEVDQWYSSGGLCLDIFFTVLVFSVSTPLMALLAPAYLVTLARRWWVQKGKGADSITQRQANALFENPALDISTKYSFTCILLLLSAFYMPILPVVSLIGLGGALFSYFVDKYLLLRRFKRPDNYGP